MDWKIEVVFIPVTDVDHAGHGRRGYVKVPGNQGVWMLRRDAP